MPLTKLRREALLRARGLYRSLGTEIRHQREDAGLSQATLAKAAEISQSYESAIEAGTVAPTIDVLERIALALGSDLSVRLFPGTGPRIRDRFQAPMIEALLRIVDPRWRPHLEVAVRHPARGFIDLVLADVTSSTLIASEAQSELRRVEQQVRWAHLKADSLAETDLGRMARTPDGECRVSRLLLLRSTRATREAAQELHSVLAAAYPARSAEALLALTTATAVWPGDAIVWVTAHGRDVSVMDGPPRGVTLGR